METWPLGEGIGPYWARVGDREIGIEVGLWGRFRVRVKVRGVVGVRLKVG